MSRLSQCQWTRIFTVLILAVLHQVHANTQTPAIEKVQPKLGPFDGGTELTVFTRNLISNDTSVLVGTFDCSILKIYERNLTCLTSRCNASIPTNYSVLLVTDGDIIKSTPDVYFTYTNTPTVSDVQPKKTIRSGGLKVTVSGSYFNHVQQPKLVLFYSPRDFYRSSKPMDDKYIVGPNNKRFKMSAHYVWLEGINIFTRDKLQVTLDVAFKYYLRRDELSWLYATYGDNYDVVIKANAIDSIKSDATHFVTRKYIDNVEDVQTGLVQAVRKRLGGICCSKNCSAFQLACPDGCKPYRECNNSTDQGLHVDVDDVVLVLVHFDKKMREIFNIESSIQKTESEPCHVISSESMWCETPAILSVPENVAAPVSVSYGLLMDNVTQLQNLTAFHRKFGEMSIYADPVFHPLSNDSKNIVKQKSSIVIQGEHLAPGITASDVMVYVAEHSCTVTTMNKTHLSCLLPPAVTDGSYKLSIQLGKKNISVGRIVVGDKPLPNGGEGRSCGALAAFTYLLITATILYQSH